MLIFKPLDRQKMKLVAVRYNNNICLTQDTKDIPSYRLNELDITFIVAPKGIKEGDGVESDELELINQIEKPIGSNEWIDCSLNNKQALQLFPFHKFRQAYRYKKPETKYEIKSSEQHLNIEVPVDFKGKITKNGIELHDSKRLIHSLTKMVEAWEVVTKSLPTLANEPDYLQARQLLKEYKVESVTVD